MPGESKRYRPYFVGNYDGSAIISFLEDDQCNLDTIKQKQHDDTKWNYYLISREAYDYDQLIATLKEVMSEYFHEPFDAPDTSFSSILMETSFDKTTDVFKLLMPAFGYDIVTLMPFEDEESNVPGDEHQTTCVS